MTAFVCDLISMSKTTVRDGFYLSRTVIYCSNRMSFVSDKLWREWQVGPHDRPKKSHLGSTQSQRCGEYIQLTTSHLLTRTKCLFEEALHFGVAYVLFYTDDQWQTGLGDGRSMHIITPVYVCGVFSNSTAYQKKLNASLQGSKMGDTAELSWYSLVLYIIGSITVVYYLLRWSWQCWHGFKVFVLSQIWQTDLRTYGQWAGKVFLLILSLWMVWQAILSFIPFN